MLALGINGYRQPTGRLGVSLSDSFLFTCGGADSTYGTQKLLGAQTRQVQINLPHTYTLIHLRNHQIQLAVGDMTLRG